VSVPMEPSVQATFTATLVDEWARSGMTDAVICPGSRSTPLALALLARDDLRLHVRLDERGAGFFALGLGLGSGRPALVCTTSGTAAAELHAAVVEAHHAGVPLLACTADRPPELQDVGAPQTIDQAHLFGRAVRWFADPGVPDDAGRTGWRPLAARAYAEALEGPGGPGPVHLNLAFRDPLVGSAGPLPARGAVGSVHPLRALPVELPPDIRHWAGRRGVVVAGDGCGPRSPVLGLAERLGWPVLADPRSGCRVPRPVVVGAADAFLRDPVVAEALLPEVVVVLGAPWASKSIAGWLRTAAAAGAEVVAVDPWWRWRDPDHVVGALYRADPAQWLGSVIADLTSGAEGPVGSAGGPWLGHWAEAEQAAQRAIDDALRDERGRSGGGLCEPGLARSLLPMLPDGARVLVSSSMPVRDLESFAPALERPPGVFANRGANGIDGVCSTALGLAATGTAPVVGLVGDLAFLHDVSALARAPGTRSGSSCTLVVVDNGGGGIFSFLPQAAALDEQDFDLLFGTPQLPRVVDVAGGFGIDVADVHGETGLAAALERFVGRSDLAVVRASVPSRSENVAVHGRIFDAVGHAVRAVVGLR